MTPAPIKPAISFDDLDKLDIRIGTVVRVEEIEESNKLLRLIVDFGDHQRIILAGMKKERENPEEIEGKQALFVVNLEPRPTYGGRIFGRHAVRHRLRGRLGIPRPGHSRARCAERCPRRIEIGD